jgi:hypothetical protein
MFITKATVYGTKRRCAWNVEYPNTGDSDILGLKACMQNVLEEIS